MLNMDDPNLDYDYPSTEIKPVIGVRLRSHANQSSKTSDYIGLRLTPNNRFNLSNSQLNGKVSTIVHSSSVDNLKLSNATNLSYDILNAPIPLAHNSQSDFNSKTYYDVPTNKPVRPQFSNLSSSCTLDRTNGAQSATNNVVSTKPSIPHKSSAVINKMSIYSKPSITLPKSCTVSNAATILPALSKQNTSKPLPLLPSERNDKLQSVPKLNANINLNGSSKADLYDTIRTYQYKDIYQEQNHHKIEDDDDGDDDECDYEYDYVCLESKKKLDSEDEIIKMKIDKNLRPKYERMVLSSLNMKTKLDNMQTSLTNTNLNNANIRSQIIQRYRQIFRIALDSFENWTLLSIEIIKHNHSPGIFFNFIKHTLLSGQTLLCAVKSLNSHIKPSSPNDLFSNFSVEFIENLRQIVLKSKKITRDSTCLKVIDEIIDSIKGALKVVHNFDVSFSRLG